MSQPAQIVAVMDGVMNLPSNPLSSADQKTFFASASEKGKAASSGRSGASASSGPLSGADQTELFANEEPASAQHPEVVIEGTSWDGESFAHPIAQPPEGSSATSKSSQSSPRSLAVPPRISADDLSCGDAGGKGSSPAAALESISGYSEL